MRHISAIDGEEVEDENRPYDAGDRESVKPRIREAKLAQQSREEVLRDFLVSAEGRAWFYGLLASCGVFRNPLGADPQLTAFHCGEQNVGQRVLSEIVSAAPELYALMLKENTNG